MDEFSRSCRDNHPTMICYYEDRFYTLEYFYDTIVSPRRQKIDPYYNIIFHITIAAGAWTNRKVVIKRKTMKSHGGNRNSSSTQTFIALHRTPIASVFKHRLSAIAAEPIPVRTPLENMADLQKVSKDANNNINTMILSKKVLVNINNRIKFIQTGIEMKVIRGIKNELERMQTDVRMCIIDMEYAPKPMPSASVKNKLLYKKEEKIASLKEKIETYRRMTYSTFADNELKGVIKLDGAIKEYRARSGLEKSLNTM